MHWKVIISILSVIYSLILTDVGHVYGHGRLVDPPSRSSVWRYGFNTEHNYEDNQLFCGGFTVSKFSEFS